MPNPDNKEPKNVFKFGPFTQTEAGFREDQAAMRKWGGEEGVQTMNALRDAINEGRFGRAALMVMKADLHDIPKHQFSSGDEKPRPAATPCVTSQEAPPRSK